MKFKFYWDSWDQEYKIYYKSLIALILLMLVAFCTFLFMGYDLSMDWLVNSSLKSLDSALEGYSQLGSLLDFNAQLFLVDQKFIGSEMVLNSIASYIYLGLVVLGLLICITISTYLGKFWYLVSVGLLMVLIISLRLELLGLFGFYDQTITIGVFLAYVIVSYYFNAFREGAGIKLRFLSFLVLTLIVTAFIYFFSGVSTPFLYIANYSFISVIAVSIVFVFLVSHEVIYAILRVTTDSSSQLNTSNTKHFVVLSLVYLLNLGLIQMHNSGFIEWDIYYINAFFLLVISSIIGFWGMKNREILYQGILPFYPYTAFLYCGLLICCFSFIGFQFYQSNDVALEVVEDAIVFGHIGFGSMFFIYIIANFINYMMKNLAVYKIAFKEDNFPYFTSRLAGLIVVAALYFSSNQVARFQGIAAFYNGIGDLYIQNDNTTAATAMYHESSRYGVNNHKANYNLGFLRDDPQKKIMAFKNATEKQPSEYAFVNLGVEYERHNKFFDALFAYQDGLEKYPKSSLLKNNLALLYSKTNVVDSTIFYLTDLSSQGFKKEVILSNLLSVCAEKRLNYNDFVSKASLTENDRFDINANLIANKVMDVNRSESMSIVGIGSTKLNLITYAYVNNLAIASYAQPNLRVLEMLNAYLADENNGEYQERLLFLKAINSYALGKVNNAFEILSNLMHSSSISGYYSTLAGIWSLQQGAAKLAVDYFDLDDERKSDLSECYLLMSYLKLGETELASEKLNLMRQEGKAPDEELMKAMSSIDIKQKVRAEEANISSKIKKAKQLEAEQKTELANAIYESLGYDNSFMESAVESSVVYYNGTGNDMQKSYDILLEAIEVNRYSEKMISLYIDQCFKMNLINYAESVVLRLLDVMGKEKFSQYEIEFDERKRELQLSGSDWE
ncbi:hypothetical protein [Reichenbachiella sp. MALMAid0571]|uniref:tetratricopeptide repeat protein n=1 Tax=Reichenbachiella sp. MALMAid0571 TaxID=3143939 RepID=UPI0032DFC788